MHRIREYQQQAIDAMLGSLNTNGSALLQMATGTGKTLCMSEISRSALRRGRVMTVANREVLVLQLARAQKQWLDLEPDIEMADMRSVEDGLIEPKALVVASIQTLASGTRLQKFRPQDFSLINFDEAHRSLANSFLEVIHYFRTGNPDIQIAGYTATAERGDKKSLGLIYSETAFSYTMPNAIDDGWLVPIRQRIAIVTGVDLDAIKEVRGELPDNQVQAVMQATEAVRFVAAESVNQFGGKKTLLFTAGIEHGRELCQVINALRPGTAQEISSHNTPTERAVIFDNFHSGRYPILLNHDIVSEGYDHPAVENIFMARPSRSRGRYAQAVGRASRPMVGSLENLADAGQRKAAIMASGKPYCTVLDFTGHAKRHNLAMAIDLEAQTEDMDEAVRERCRAILADGQWHETEEVMERAKREIATEAEEKRSREAAEKLQRLKVNGFQNDLHFRVHTRYEDIDPFGAIGIKPPKDGPWMANPGRPATPNQVAALQRMGMPRPALKNMGFDAARQTFARIEWRRKRGLCTMAQSLWLTSHGYDGNNTTFEEAMKIRDAYENERRNERGTVQGNGTRRSDG